MKRKTMLAGLVTVALLGVAVFLALRPEPEAEVDVPFQATRPADYHNGYWVAEVDLSWSPVPITAINDLHLDPETDRVTVYAQARVLGRVIAPAQVRPGACTEQGGERVCSHPNAVYLNGSGQELAAADGSGAWWVKHSWVLGGEGYENCELKPAEVYDRCLWAEGRLLEDGLTMKIGGVGRDGAKYYNTRLPVVREGEITYLATRFGPVNSDPDAGAIDLRPRVMGGLTLRCREVPGPLDGLTRGCPGFTRGR